MLWDVDYTLVSADGLGTRLYEVVFGEMFGRELTAVAPKAGRTDRAIIGDTLALAGVSRTQVDAFVQTVAHLQCAHGINESRDKGGHDIALHVEAIRSGACLATIAHLCDDGGSSASTKFATFMVTLKPTCSPSLARDRSLSDMSSSSLVNLC